MTQSGRRERTKNWVNKSNKIYWDESFKIILLTKGKERIKHAFTSRSSDVYRKMSQIQNGGQWLHKMAAHS